MANIVDFSKVGTSAYPNTFVRGGAFSLDKTSLWFSLAEAENYAKTDGKAYVGQILSVYENGSTTVWKINDAEGNLVQIDGEVIVDVNVDPADGKVYATVPFKAADPSKWTQSNKTDGSFTSVTYADGKFVAGCNNYKGIWYSTNGSEWNQSNLTSGDFSSIIYADGKFIAAGSDYNGIWYSANGSEWTRSNNSDGRFTSVTYGDGKFVAASYDSGIWYSTNGSEWSQSTGAEASFLSITYGDGKFIAGSDNGVWYSANGSEWTRSNLTERPYSSIIYADSKFVAVGGDYNGIWYSTNGIDWTQSNLTSGFYSSITYGDGKFVVASDSGIWYSTNGSEWIQSTGSEASFLSVTYADGKFVATGDYNGIWYSANGSEWTRSNNSDGNFTSVTYGDGKFVAAGNGICYSDSTEGTAKKQLAYQEDLERAVLGDLSVALERVDAELAKKATKTELADAISGVNAEVSKKADTTYVNEELAKKLDIETAESDYLKKTDAASAYTVAVTSADGEGSVLKKYTITQGKDAEGKDIVVGTIDIPKDLVVTSGSVIIATAEDTGCTVGEKYIKLTIANQTAPIYIAVKDLVDVYTEEKNAAEVQLSISDTNEISATIVEGSITKAKLESSVQASLDKADAAAVKSEVDEALGTINETLEDHAGRIDALEKATTLDDAKAYTDAEIQKLDGSATIASVADGVVTIKAGITETDGVVSQGTGADITLVKVATTGKAEDISISDTEGKITATTVEGALTELAKAIDSHHTVMTTGDKAGTIKYGDEGCGNNYQEVAVAYKDGENLGEAVARLDGDENTEGSVAKIAKDTADAAINELDAEVTQTAGADGLALSITQVDGKITAISGSIAAETYDAHGAAAKVKTDVIGTDADVSTADTIKGAKKYAQEVAASEASKVSSKIYLGTTTTSLVDNNISTIKINDEDVVAATGSMAMYNGELYIWTGSKWEAASKHTTELATKADKTYVDEELAKKVDKTTTIAGVDLQDNITKEELLTALNVEDGAQVNKIEVVKVGGVALTITDKSVDIDNLILDGGGAITTIA